MELFLSVRGSLRVCHRRNSHKLYMQLEKKGKLFYEPDGKKKRTCDLNGPDHGCSGADWWLGLQPPHDGVLKDLAKFAMRLLGQKGQESAAERHYSLTANVQTTNRGRLGPDSMEKRCLFRAEVLQEIAVLGDPNNHGLQTVDEAAEADGEMAAEEAAEEAAEPSTPAASVN